MPKNHKQKKKHTHLQNALLRLVFANRKKLFKESVTHSAAESHMCI